MQVQIAPEILVKIKKHHWSRRLKLSINHKGSVNLTIPWYCTYFEAKLFLNQKKSWIMESLNKLPPPSSRTKPELSALKKKARLEIEHRVRHYAALYSVQYNRIAIRDQASVWGSCSRQKNLNFSWRIILAPETIRNYVIVHEVCHLREMNHSPKFWSLVALSIPEYKSCRKWLKASGKDLN